MGAREPDEIYVEACMIVGECCLMLADRGAETNRTQLINELQKLLVKVKEDTDQVQPAIELAIALLGGKYAQKTRRGGRVRKLVLLKP